ncbi:hypothetical protein CDAR_179901 [Caerostris darwini]|uniref:Uncharacterized protein n=1 Tax=Caerostris darwini TaxID=1538125 RepID=A0AAV4N344_9ARAC|nr:hypothetical protein CDAR_179901 [Caerostris darwini]
MADMTLTTTEYPILTEKQGAIYPHAAIDFSRREQQPCKHKPTLTRNYSEPDIDSLLLFLVISFPFISALLIACYAMKPLLKAQRLSEANRRKQTAGVYCVQSRYRIGQI